MKSTFARATAVAVSVGLLAGSAVYEGYATNLPTSSAPGAMQLALAKASAPDDVVVVVNGHEVTRGEVDEQIDSMLGGQVAGMAPDQLEGIRAQLAARVTDGVIVKTLLEQAVAKEGVEVDPAKVADALGQIEGALPPGKTMADYADAMGTTEQGLKSEVALSLKIEKLMSEKASAVAPTAADVERFYAENAEMFQAPERADVRHILVALPPEADDATRAEKRKVIDDVRAELLASESPDFAAAAKASSDCPSKADGGRLGMVARGDTVAEFEAAVFAQKPGEIGDVVETPFGFHIVRVERLEPAGKISLAEAKGFIEERLTQEQQRTAMDEYISGLRAQAEVVFPKNESA